MHKTFWLIAIKGVKDARLILKRALQISGGVGMKWKELHVSSQLTDLTNSTMLNLWVPQYGRTVFQAELWPILCPAGCIALVKGGALK
jgi:hypothetical protein